MGLNILDENEIEKIERRLSEKYKKPIEIDIKRDKDAWYDIERLILELRYLSIAEIQAIANSEKCLDALKELLFSLTFLIELVKKERRVK